MAPEVFDFALAGAPAAQTDGPEQLPTVRWFAPHSLHTGRVARAWQQRGELADLRDITGPWAAVLWQPRTRTHFVVTDPLGVQPVFWTIGPDGRCYVSSWLDRLLDHSPVSPSVDYEAVLLDAGDGLMVDRHAHRTRFVGVSRVLWGRAVQFDANGVVRTVQYWDRGELPEPDESLGLDDSAELFAAQIDQAIRRVTSQGEGFGAHVSGGLDCTTVAIRANQILRESGDRIRMGYSWSPPEQMHARVPGDERALLDHVTAQEGIGIRRIADDGRGHWFWSRDINRYPQSTHALERLVLPTAKADGVHVLLSGWGGDEIASFNGRRVLDTLLRRRHFGVAAQQASQRVQKVGPDGPAANLQTANMLANALAPRLSEMVIHPRRSWSDFRWRSQVDSALRSRWPAVAASRREAAQRYARIRDYRDYQWYLLANGHLQHRTTWWYQTGRLFDVAYRYPLLDLDLVKAAFRVPWTAYLHGGWTRVAFRKAASHWVPHQVAWNPTKKEPAQVSGYRMLVDRPPGPLPALAGDPQLAAVLEFSDSTYRSRRGR